MQNSSVSLLTAAVTAVVVFLFAWAWFMSKAARNTLRAAKASVPVARKAVWSAMGDVFKMGLLVAVLALSLVAWVIGSEEETAGKQPAPAPSASPR